MSLINHLEKLVSRIQYSDREERILLKFVERLGLLEGDKILDIGCGYGNKMKLLKSKGFEILGIDVNENIVRKNIEEGLNCITAREFGKNGGMYGLLLMSHIIEHFPPGDLCEFMDDYLDRLKPGGHLIIATPLNCSYFHEDFDHVKPYHPTGIAMVFSGGASQVRFTARNSLKLVDLWFRKGPYKLTFYRGLYLSKYSRFPLVLNLIFGILFHASFGVFGKKDGWLGLYKKVGGASVLK